MVTFQLHLWRRGSCGCGSEAVLHMQRCQAWCHHWCQCWCRCSGRMHQRTCFLLKGCKKDRGPGDWSRKHSNREVHVGQEQLLVHHCHGIPVLHWHRLQEWVGHGGECIQQSIGGTQWRFHVGCHDRDGILRLGVGWVNSPSLDTLCCLGDWTWGCDQGIDQQSYQ